MSTKDDDYQKRVAAWNSRDIKLRFGNKVAAMRKFAKLSQSELARRSGLHRTHLVSIERGKKNVSLVNIEKIANGLGRTISGLFRSIAEPPLDERGDWDV